MSKHSRKRSKSEPTSAKAKVERTIRDAQRADIAAGHATKRLGEHPVIGGIAALGAFADQPPMIAVSAATLAAGLILRRPRLARTGVRMLVAHGLATGIKGWIKHRIDRHRPSVDGGDHRLKRGVVDESAHNSFPSGHSAGAVAVSRAIVRDYPGLATPANALAGFAVLAPLPAGRHFPVDVAVGSMIGLAAEAIASRTLDALPPRLLVATRIAGPI